MSPKIAFLTASAIHSAPNLMVSDTEDQVQATLSLKNFDGKPFHDLLFNYFNYWHLLAPTDSCPTVPKTFMNFPGSTKMPLLQLSSPSTLLTWQTFLKLYSKVKIFPKKCMDMDHRQVQLYRPPPFQCQNCWYFEHLAKCCISTNCYPICTKAGLSLRNMHLWKLQWRTMSSKIIIIIIV